MEMAVVLVLLMSTCGFTAYVKSTWTTSDSPSCRYNCGYDLGTCSCSSSCQYYGRCCHDYYDYCYYYMTPTEPTTETTTVAAPTSTVWTDYNTCEGRCGYDGGLCSCRSDCGYNCCPDYYYYCSGTTPYPGSSCGGTLTQPQGEFFSPGYPYNYPNNARCSWTLQGSEGQVVSLRFTFVDFERCCDRISVYDGPSDRYQLLGTFVELPNNAFNSSGKYMTVLFTSDGSVTAKGFRAQWIFKNSPSCRYNCGYDLGTCSCSSSCQYYGRCCRDYYDYCSSTTPPVDYNTCEGRCGYDGGLCSCRSNCGYNCCPDYYYYCSSTTPYPEQPQTTSSPNYWTDSPSCRYNCGYDLGTCSCSSSCQYYGRCCRDYYDYCYVTTTEQPQTTSPNYWTGSSCGGTLTQPQGEFFSPGYPYNYPNNARCSWTLQGSEGQVVSLRFTFVDFERCCDRIRVYDGPSDRYQLLGTFVELPNNTFISSGKYMTVLFTSDGSVTAKGFRAEWNFSRSVCGGSLHVSGEFSSPYYPNDYQNDAQCEWTLSAPAGQTILLSFIDIDLEHCCNCDYLHVYDGPSSASPLIATVCQESSQLTMHSSSSHMTVQFRSDHSVVGRGFKAFFSSSLNHNTGQVDCSSDLLNITVRKSYVESLGYDWHQLTLDEPWCQAYNEFMDSDFILFTYPLSECGTVRKVDNGRVIYTNNVRVPSYNPSEITRQRQNLLLKVSCTMDQTTTVGTLYNVLEIGNSSIGGTGKFDTVIKFYPSSNFSHPITQFPYQVDLDQDVYVQVQLSRPDSNLQLFLDTCVASPSQNFSSRIYYLIRNGCETDNTLHVYTNGRESFARFMFRTFMFLRAHNSVFLKCEVAICPDSNLNSRCHQGCRLRKKRSLGSTHRTEVVTLGPITLRAGSEKEVKMKKEE